MNIAITPALLSGCIDAIPSKSCAHRALICAAFAKGSTKLNIQAVNADIEATAGCLTALGAAIQRTDWGYEVSPVRSVPHKATLRIRESGSTLRFLLPVCGVLGVETTFLLEGRLPQRPLSPLWEEMERMGCTLTRPTADTLRCQGKLKSGKYTIDGGVSSQYITGLLFALSLMGGGKLNITGKIESLPYIEMTQKAMSIFGVRTNDYIVAPGQSFHTPGIWTVEGDWSNGAFFLAAQALGNPLDVQNLNPDSPQGDRASASLLKQLNENIVIDASDIPDLVPILSIVAGAKNGAIFKNIQRLRIKESDRVASTIAMVEALGGRAEATADTLRIYGTGFRGGTVDAQNDHRIAMSAAIAAIVCNEPVTVLGAEAVKKSYPKFWDEYARLGGNYEQYLR